jgi:Ca-activated chloride channel family protein
MAMIEQIEMKEAAGAQPVAESHDAIQNLGVTYQLVTDYTSMVVLDDAGHARRGIARHNQQRTAVERAAQSVRSAQPARQSRSDVVQPAFSARAPHVSSSGGGGGGDLGADIVLMTFMGTIVVVGLYFGRRSAAGK